LRIVIAGMGDVGFHLAKQLSSEQHDIIAIDIDRQKLNRVDTYSDVLTVAGSSSSIATLINSRINGADLLVAVTSSEEINLTTAILAKQLGAKKTIARISNAEYVDKDSPVKLSSVGVDYMIYPEELAAIETVKLIERSAATDVLDFENGKLTLIGLKIDKTAPSIHKTMTEIVKEYPEHDFRIVAIYRGMKTIIPTGKDKILPNDQIFVITKPEGIEDILKLAGKENVNFKNVMILGGGKIGRTVAKMLENDLNVKVIESDEDKTFELAGYLDKSLVIQGDGKDIDLLAQEGIIDMDVFVALTSNAETNIISCLMAKHLGVKKTIALVDNVDYIPLTQTIGLDSLINKKLIAANNITRFIRKSEVVSVASLQGIDSIVLEYNASANSPITKNEIKDLGFPKEAIIGGIIRNGKGIIPVGNTIINADDKVVIFSLPAGVKKIEKYF
jgi:trk system potassium uptake protein